MYFFPFPPYTDCKTTNDHCQSISGLIMAANLHLISGGLLINEPSTIKTLLPASINETMMGVFFFVKIYSHQSAPNSTSANAC